MEQTITTTALHNLTCSTCGEQKPCSDFFICNSSPSRGYEYNCKKCSTEKKISRPSYKEIHSRYAKSHKTEVNARWAVSQALRDGKITRPTVCEKCYRDYGKIDAHHDDYSKRLDIRWLCTKCHYEYHHGQAVCDAS